MYLLDYPIIIFHFFNYNVTFSYVILFLSIIFDEMFHCIAQVLCKKFQVQSYIFSDDLYDSSSFLKYIFLLFLYRPMFGILKKFLHLFLNTTYLILFLLDLLIFDRSSSSALFSIYEIPEIPSLCF